MDWMVSPDAIESSVGPVSIAPAPQRSFWDSLAGASAAQLAAEAVPSRAVQTASQAAWDEIGSPGFLHRVAKNIGATWDEGYYVDHPDADINALKDAYGRIVAAVNQGRPAGSRFAVPLHPITPEDGFGDYLPNLGNRLLGMDTSQNRLWAAVADMKRTDPGRAANLPSNYAELVAQSRAAQRAYAAKAQTVRTESGPVAAFTGQLIGGGAASFTDPLNVALMGAGAPASAGLLRTFLYEGALNAAADAVELPSRIAHREDLGIEAPDAAGVAAELGGDFLLGGGIASGLKGLGRVFLGHGDLVREFDTRFPDPSDDARAARAVVAEQARHEFDNPYTPDERGLEEFRDNLNAATAAVDNRLPLLGEPWLGYDPYDQHIGALYADLKAAQDEMATLPQASARDLERYARLQQVGSELAGKDFQTSDVKALQRRRDELLTDTTPETLKTSAMAADRRRVLAGQAERLQAEIDRVSTEYRLSKLFRPLQPGDRGYASRKDEIVWPVAHPEDPATFGRRLTDGQREEAARFASPDAPKAMAEQTRGLATELRPQASPPMVREKSALPAENIGPVDENAAQSKNWATIKFGDAAPEIETLRALDQNVAVPAQDHLDLFGRDGGPVTMRDVTKRIEEDAVAVERLRNCLLGGTP